MELVVTEVQRGVDGFKRLKVYVDFLLFALVCHNGPTVHHQAVRGHCKREMGLNSQHRQDPVTLNLSRLGGGIFTSG